MGSPRLSPGERMVLRYSQSSACWPWHCADGEAAQQRHEISCARPPREDVEGSALQGLLQLQIHREHRFGGGFDEPANLHEDATTLVSTGRENFGTRKAGKPFSLEEEGPSSAKRSFTAAQGTTRDRTGREIAKLGWQLDNTENCEHRLDAASDRTEESAPHGPAIERPGPTWAAMEEHSGELRLAPRPCSSCDKRRRTL
jgi:hypothetical protein